ncbi:MAG: DUF1934 domain-containing protein [Lachnospiraceae bacterium]|nr:DUF1934 domain-containing protein [Lachnospiraceae bacterium]
MTKEVLISVKGMQMAGEDSDSLEVICSGNYYFKNGKHYLIYEEVVDETTQAVKNTVIISDGKFELKKNGVVSTNMTFEEKKKNITYYETPVGNLMMGIDTRKIVLEESENEIVVTIKYALDINYEFVSDCEIRFKITALNN